MHVQSPISEPTMSRVACVLVPTQFYMPTDQNLSTKLSTIGQSPTVQREEKSINLIYFQRLFLHRQCFLLISLFWLHYLGCLIKQRKLCKSVGSGSNKVFDCLLVYQTAKRYTCSYFFLLKMSSEGIEPKFNGFLSQYTTYKLQPYCPSLYFP